MDVRLLGKTGLRASELGICLPDDRGRAAEIARKAADHGVTLFMGGPELSAGQCFVSSARVAIVTAASATDLPEKPACVAVRYNVLDQSATHRLMPAAYRGGHGIVATHVFGGGSLAGRVAHTPPGAAVLELAKLVKAHRTLAQLAIQAALANEYVSCAVVRVSSVQHLEEALGAFEAEPLTLTELEHIFETYANRYDHRR